LSAREENPEHADGIGAGGMAFFCDRAVNLLNLITASTPSRLIMGGISGTTLEVDANC
jgi:hypothetical protein